MNRLARYMNNTGYLVLWVYTVWALIWPVYAFAQNEHHILLKILLGIVAIAAFFGIGGAVVAVGNRVRWLREHLLRNHHQALDEETERHLRELHNELLESPCMGVAILVQMSKGG